VKHLAAFPRLRDLNLQETSIDDSGRRGISSKWRICVFSDCTAPKSRRAGIAELKAALPKCAIFWDGGAVIPGATSPLPASAATAAANPKSQIENPKSAATGSYALEFNGKDSYVDLPTVRYDGSHPITLETTIVPYKNLEGAMLSVTCEVEDLRFI